jgi:lipopolysaccharide export system protein LptA
MKGRLLSLIIIIGCVFFLACADSDAQGAEFNKKSPADNHPIEISADRLEAYDAKKVVLFSGNAVATQGDRVIKADKIFLYYGKEERETGREGLRDIGKTGDLEKIEAKGHVSVSQGDRLVTGEQAVYYQDSQKIVMTGSAVMQQGNNIVRGDKIEVFLNENRGVVEAAENKRVKATIYPVEKK